MIVRSATWGLIALYVLLLAGIAALWLSTATIVNGSLVAVGVVFGGVGAVLTLRRPRNAVGWMCFAIAVFGASQAGALAYATQAFNAPGTLPGGTVAAWWAGWSANPPFFVLTIFLPLLFPTGRPPSARWRPLLWAAFASFAMLSVIAAFSPGPLTGAPAFENPFALAFLGEPAALLARGIIPAGSVAVTISCMASVVVRYRHADADERHQIKWVAGAFVFMLIVLMLGSLAQANVGVQVMRTLLWWDVVWPLSVAAVPVAMGIAVLRYRLYDIDIIIRRTVVYGATTIAVAATFFGGVLVVESLLRPFTAGNELAVAASTLASVALFQPFRRRIQAAVDRRFFRARYDAARTLDAFAEELRNEVDLEAVRVHLLGAVGQTMSPAHASVWLRERAP